MRFRLRTLLIPLAVGPPLLALAWALRGDFDLETAGAMAFSAVVVGMCAVLLDVVPWLFRESRS